MQILGLAVRWHRGNGNDLFGNVTESHPLPSIYAEIQSGFYSDTNNELKRHVEEASTALAIRKKLHAKARVCA